MKIKNVIKLAAELVGRLDISEYLDNGLTEDVSASKEDVDRFLSAYNSALLFTASEFEPLSAFYRAEGVDSVLFSDLKDRAIGVISVKDEMGNELDYEIKIDRLALKKQQSVAIVCYRYLPEDRGLDGETDYGLASKITPRVLAYGTAAEFCQMSGDVAGYKQWREKFERGALACVRPRGKLLLPKRRWY